MFKKNGLMIGMQPASTTIIIFLMLFGNHGVSQFFWCRHEVGCVIFLANSISLNDPDIKGWESEMVVYLMKISYPECPFFSRLAKFQQCMFKRIH